MSKPNFIRNIIRENFKYLIDEFSFIEEIPINSIDIYSEVCYKKNGWTISIKTMSHGTKISISIISPTSELGFLNHYFNTLENNFKELSRTKTIVDDIKFYSIFLKQNGKDIFEVNHTRMLEILAFVNVQQDIWTK